MYAVTIYNKVTGEVIDYGTFYTEQEAASYGRVSVSKDMKNLYYKVRKLY